VDAGFGGEVVRSRPIGTPLSEQEAATVARFDAAPDAEESLLETVARAVALADGYPFMLAPRRTGVYRRLAGAAIAVMRGEQP
jgi:hypothetical protein